MPYSPAGAAGAGLLAALLSALVLYAAVALFPRELRLNAFRFLGLAFPGPRAGMGVYLAGFALYLALGVASALAYGGLYQAFDAETDVAAWGVLFGAFHWLVDGMGLGLVARRHAGVADGRLADPGLFALNLPLSTGLGFFALHLLFGALTGAFYDALR